MFKESYNVLGIMSGTSLDGIDLAHINFTIKNNRWSFTLYETETIPYESNWLNKLKTAVDFSRTELEKLNEDYTLLLGNTIKSFIKKHQLINLDAVCSHGHTILHQPQNGYTLQIGNLPEIAEIVGVTVVCDFRVQDVKLGGQGAPLVPIGDRILFSEYDYCLNLGGFSNISFEQNGKRIAFDISPVNTVLNFYANKLGLAYDDKGTIARSGESDLNLMEELDALAYYQKPFPKSLGFEFVKTVVLPLMESYDISIEDKMHTFVKHIAKQTAFALPERNGKMLITGGGTYNDFLLESMQNYLPEMSLVVPDAKTLEYKEALIFALLGILKLRKEVNVLSSVTGAKKDHSSGKIYPI
ncbi:anhydro-N-acetylmuramic acid kinase [Flavobacterium sp.]|jgi:anhydro-N-acetylmuramic acid kinase|uniref:anhydro-N-acetylmuramic acid kinase n=1 Tax=Flavobacterium sp. TaxID=239 RepID=UPI0022C74B92|nr:anhydro-N-acetylmuramic acid kinase [Flavobacterium sp.]MCZ8089177.1 anhydro-N-acetylmuramic acid kinase [Flavobacterium sp.]